MLDRLARAVMRRARPVRFSVAADESERLAAYRLRGKAAVASGWAAPDDLSDGIERDEGAIQIVGWVEDEAVATTRVVVPERGHRLPAEQAFGIDLSSLEGVVEFGRTVVERAHTRPDHGVFAAVLGAAWLEARRCGCHRMCGADTPAMITLLRRMGFVVTALGPPAEHWGDMRCPILVDVVASTEALASRWDGAGDGVPAR